MIIIQLIYNLAVLISVSVMSGFIDSRWDRKTATGQILQGLNFGLIAILAMLNPFMLTPGIIFDGRSIVLSLCALFFGPVAGSIAALMALATRIIIGGSGTIMGVSVIISSTIIGLLANLTNQRKNRSVNIANLYLLGIVVHVFMLILMFYLPSNYVWLTFQTIAISVIIFYPVATVIIGKILSDQGNNSKLFSEISESEKRFRSLYEDVPVGLYRTTPDGKILLSNPALLQILGYSSYEELTKVNLETNGFESPEQRKQFIEKIEKDGVVHNLESKWEVANGKHIFVKENAKVIRDSKGNTLYYDGTVKDITEQKLAEESIRNSLAEKELLLKEIHHRVKNNLQIISSLLNLQSNYIEDEKSHKFFTESISRVKSMAIIHEKLYQSENLRSIDLNDYLTGLVSYLFRTYDVNYDVITPVLEVENISLPLDTAIPCGLIINELIANTIEHAFPKGKTGQVNISFKMSDGEYFITVSDNGIGLSEDFEIDKADSLGIKLVSSLARQLSGKVEFTSNSGTEFRISFPSNK